MNWGWMDIFYFSITIAALVLSAMGLWFTAIMPGVDRWNKRFFRNYFTLLIAVCLASFPEAIFAYFHFSSAVIYFTVVMQAAALSLPLLLLPVYLTHSASENARGSRLVRGVLVSWAVYLLILFVGPFTGAFLTITPENEYIRGPLYPLLMLPMISILLFNLVGAIRRRALLPRKVMLGFSITLPLMIATLIANMFFNAIPLFDLSFIFSALVMFSFVLSDQVTHDLNRQRELASQRASIAVLQMRPHFIYNTLTSIYCLCNQDPAMARKVILDFTTYLRNNFTAVASTEPVAFSAELEHTHAYLSVEQAQYEDSLHVDYDIRHTAFRLPPLTLQPIVENAVKHGKPPARPLYISIRTQKTDGASEITVTDDGLGFQDDENSEPHIALNNIRERLELMCGGSLTVERKDGGGTVVTVTIPDSKKDAEENPDDPQA